MLSRHSITVTNRDTVFTCSDQQSLLHGIASQQSKAIQVGCRGGGCGVCKIQVVSGDYASKKMSAKHVTQEQQSMGVVLSCRIFPRSDMAIEALDSPTQS